MINTLSNNLHPYAQRAKFLAERGSDPRENFTNDEIIQPERKPVYQQHMQQIILSL